MDVAALIKHLDLVITPDTVVLLTLHQPLTYLLYRFMRIIAKAINCLHQQANIVELFFQNLDGRLDGYNVGKIIENSISLIAKK